MCLLNRFVRYFQLRTVSRIYSVAHSRQYSFSVMDVLHNCKKLIPALSETSHKGSCGRIGVVGGSVEFTGAPYFASISALKTGADLVYVFTATCAAPVIKSFSPELMVLPFLDVGNGVHLMTPWLKRLHCLLIGPGLGKNALIFKSVSQILEVLMKSFQVEGTKAIPIIFDADGISFLIKNVDIIAEYPGDIYLTPNRVEFANLASALLGASNHDPVERQIELITQGCGEKVTIIFKCNVDKICCGQGHLDCAVIGSPRRCGGQGDLLSGVLATFAFWANEYKRSCPNTLPSTLTETMLAGYAACCMTRTCNRLAFDKMSRSMLVTDMISEIHNGFKFLFD